MIYLHYVLEIKSQFGEIVLDIISDLLIVSM